jgi:very-short-patch-repair endonuclease
MQPTLAQLHAQARALRQNPTRAEARLWPHLKKSRIGWRFRRQHVLYPYIVDFYCARRKLCIELDGPVHDAERDARRDARLNTQHGVDVVRFKNDDVEFHLAKVVQSITHLLDEQTV